jgi:hypothetical protein
VAGQNLLELSRNKFVPNPNKTAQKLPILAMNFEETRLAKISLCFQALPNFVGGSMQHGCSMK